MPRLIASFGLLAFVNLSFNGAGGACPLAETHGVKTASVFSEHSEHQGHGMPSSSDQNAVDGEETSEPAHPACPMMGPCVPTVDVSRTVMQTVSAAQSAGVEAWSDRLPPSRTTSPDIPPPRA